MEQLPWLSHALALSPQDAEKHFADEVVYWLNERGVVRGLTHHLVEACAISELSTNANSVWQAAYEVIRHRLPDCEHDAGIIETYLPEETPSWSIDESLIALLLARVSHPELKRKTTALVGLAKILSLYPSLAIAPLRYCFSLDTPLSSILAILRVIVEAEPTSYPITKALQNEFQGFAKSGLFGLRVLAKNLLERAGIETITVLGNFDYSISENIGQRKQVAVLSLDCNERIEHIAGFWPEFPSLVAKRFNYIWESSSIHKERSRLRQEAATSWLYNKLPQLRMFAWEDEVFECALNEILNGVDETLWRSGLWRAETNFELALSILPNLPLYIAKWHSRTVRPRLSLPHEQYDYTAGVETIRGDDEYSGWVRCGYVERELIIRGWHDFAGYVTAVSDIQFPDIVQSPDSYSPLLAVGEAETWFQLQEPTSKVIYSFRGPLVGVERVDDKLGLFPVLVLHPMLMATCHLRPYPDSRKYTLLDSSNQDAVVLRYWNTRPLDDAINSEHHRLEGCELLIRPDIFDRISQIGGSSPITVKKVFRSNDDNHS